MMLAPPKGNAALRKEQKNTITEPLQAEEKLACKSVLVNKWKYNLAGTMLVHTIKIKELN